MTHRQSLHERSSWCAWHLVSPENCPCPVGQGWECYHLTGNGSCWILQEAGPLAEDRNIIVHFVSPYQQPTVLTEQMWTKVAKTENFLPENDAIYLQWNSKQENSQSLWLSQHLDTHFEDALQLQPASDRRCGRSVHLWPVWWPLTFPEDLEASVEDWQSNYVE